MSQHTLGDLAATFGLEVRGDPATQITGVCTLSPGKAGGLSFLSNPRYRSQLAATAAAAVVIGQKDAVDFIGNGLVARDPYLAYARIAQLFDDSRVFEPGIAATAVVAASAQISPGVFVGPNTVIGERARVAVGSFIGPGCVIGRDVSVGEASRLIAQVHVGDRVQLGRRCLVQPGAVIGSRGFGNAMGPKGWEEVPQLGSVLIGDDVEIGAGTCIDRGAIEDTVIANGVRLDNLIQVAHNCHIGEHTAIAACVGIAGSTRIGARCMIGGAVGISGHLVIGDDVVILGMAMVVKSLPRKGVYGSGVPVAEARDWRKQIARMRRLEHTESRLKALEQQLGIESKRFSNGDDGRDDDQD